MCNLIIVLSFSEASFISDTTGKCNLADDWGWYFVKNGDHLSRQWESWPLLPGSSSLVSGIASVRSLVTVVVGCFRKVKHWLTFAMNMYTTNHQDILKCLNKRYRRGMKRAPVSTSCSFQANKLEQKSKTLFNKRVFDLVDHNALAFRRRRVHRRRSDRFQSVPGFKWRRLWRPHSGRP